MHALLAAAPITVSRLIERGTFTPSPTPTPQAARFGAFKTGIMFGFNMNAYQGFNENVYGKIDPAPRTLYQNDRTTFNVEAWADFCKSVGAQYAVITMGNEFGFQLYETKVPYRFAQIPMTGTRTNGTTAMSPCNPFPYCVKPGIGDVSLIDRFCVAMRKRGIEPVPYMNMTLNMNIGDRHTGNGQPAQRVQDIINYNAELVQEYLLRFKFKYLWWDVCAVGPGISPAAYQKWYNAVKSIDPTCMVLGNAIGTTDFSFYPYDLQSTEAMYPNVASVAGNRFRLHAGTNYQIPQEMVETPIGNAGASIYQWYYTPPAAPVQASYAQNTVRPLADMQALTNSARTNGCPILWNMCVDAAGVMIPANVTAIQQMNLA